MSHPKGTRPNAVGPFSVPSRGTYSNLLPTAEALRPLAEAHAKRAEIEAVEAMADRAHPKGKHPDGALGYRVALGAIRADREQIAAWCDGKAAEAKREAEAHDAQRAVLHLEIPRNLVAYSSKSDRICRCEGQASAFEAVAAMLRGAR